MITVLAVIKEQLNTSSSSPSLVLQVQRKVSTCVQILDALSQTWPIASMMSEISEQVFSEKKFRDMFEAATKELQGDDEVKEMASKRQYKRVVPTAKQSRPEMMLPKTRVTVKMLLNTADAGVAVRTHTSRLKSISSEISDKQKAPETSGAVRDTARLDVNEDKSSGRRTKIPRHSYTSGVTAGERHEFGYNSSVPPLFTENCTATLPPINDWSVEPVTGEEEQPGKGSIDFDEW